MFSTNSASPSQSSLHSHTLTRRALNGPHLLCPASSQNLPPLPATHLSQDRMIQLLMRRVPYTARRNSEKATWCPDRYQSPHLPHHHRLLLDDLPDALCSRAQRDKGTVFVSLNEKLFLMEGGIDVLKPREGLKIKHDE